VIVNLSNNKQAVVIGLKNNPTNIITTILGKKPVVNAYNLKLSLNEFGVTVIKCSAK